MKSLLRTGAGLLAAAALIAAAAPSAQAAPRVCNQASPHFLGGGLVALDPPVNSPAARYTVDLSKLPGNGAGLVDAAAKSPSLTVCDGGEDDVVVYSEETGDVTEVDDGLIFYWDVDVY